MAGAPRSTPPDALERVLVDHIATSGPIGFDEFVAHALYTPEVGFYQRGGGAGRKRDFLTSPEVGPLFGAVIAHALDRWWDDMGRPPHLTVVEVGAGPGTLARSILAATPRCSAALQMVLVEVGTAQWDTHPRGVSSRTDLPAPGDLEPGPVVVLANELLDNLPFGLVERTETGWAEVQVTLSSFGGPGAGPVLAEVLVPLDDTRSNWCHLRAPAAEPGARIPVQAEASAWLADALRLIDTCGGGGVLAIDYCSSSADMAGRAPEEWLRTYAAHGRAGSPLEMPGSRDITCEVAVDQLALVRAPDRDVDQASYLRENGLDDLVEEGRRLWAEQGFNGGLPALAARSRVPEAAALTDPAGLGGFRVLLWRIGAARHAPWAPGSSNT